MDVISVNRDKMILTLKDNKASHVKIYEEACTGFLKEVEKIMSSDASPTIKIQQINGLRCPENHSREYDVVIKMCSMSVEENIKLTQSDFRQYMCDQWNWADDFLYSNAAYSATARAKYSA